MVQMGEQGDAAVRQQVGQGFELLRQGRIADALALSDRLLAAHMGNMHALYFGAEARFAAGETDRALKLIEGAVKAAPGLFAFVIRQAQMLATARRRMDARAVAARAGALAGADAQALRAVAQVFSQCDDPAGAKPWYEKALKAAPGNPALLFDLASCQFFLGDADGAETSLAALLKSLPGNGKALYLRSILRRQTATANHVAALEAQLKAGCPDAEGRYSALYALAKEYEDLGDAGKSFAALKEGAALRRQSLRYDAAAELGSIEAIRTAYTADVMTADTKGHDGAGAIFIVGMPRTGTTLVERMLGRHTDVVSAGELPDFAQLLGQHVSRHIAANPGKAANMVQASLDMDFAALGADYMAGARQAAGGSQVFIDKMPVNFIYTGLIRKALPKARIIHLARDPMDSCYAVFKTLFNQSYHFSYDLKELAAYYAAYARTMTHWHRVMPGDILDVRYEDLVSDFDTQARRVLDWCGLSWQDAVLAPSENDRASTTASAAQVREPVYTSSVQKWRRYADGLAPLLAALQAEGIVDADGNPITERT